MSKSPQPECPECEKLSAVADESNNIGDFLDWLDNKGFLFCKYDKYEESYYPTYPDTQKLLAEYFNIDLNKVEQERRALLQWLQE